MATKCNQQKGARSWHDQRNYADQQPVGHDQFRTAHILPAMYARIEPIAHEEGKLTAGTRSLFMTPHILPAMNASIEPIAHKSGNEGKLTAGTRAQKRKRRQTHSGNSKHAAKRREGRDTHLPIIMGKPSPNPPPKPPPYGKAMATAQNKITSQALLHSTLSKSPFGQLSKGKKFRKNSMIKL